MTRIIREELHFLCVHRGRPVGVGQTFVTLQRNFSFFLSLYSPATFAKLSQKFIARRRRRPTNRRPVGVGAGALVELACARAEERGAAGGALPAAGTLVPCPRYRPDIGRGETRKKKRVHVRRAGRDARAVSLSPEVHQRVNRSRPRQVTKETSTRRGDKNTRDRTYCPPPPAPPIQ